MEHDPQEPADDAVGYGKPPKASRFKPGHSGNPKGRPKGPGNLPNQVAKHAAKKVTVIEGGTKKKMAKLDVVIAAMFNKAAKGDVAAAKLIATLLQTAADLSADTNSGYTDEDLKVILAEADWQAKLVQLKKAQ